MGDFEGNCSANANLLSRISEVSALSELPKLRLLFKIAPFEDLLNSALIGRFKRELLRKRKLPESDFGSFGASETSETPFSFKSAPFERSS